MPDFDHISWNTIIGALAAADASVLEAVEHFMDMIRAGFRPNRVTFINVLGAVLSLSIIQLVQQTHALVLKHSVSNDCFIENAFLACYGKAGEIDSCEKIFSRMGDRKDEGSWNSMISGYVHNELLSKAIDFVWFMMQRGERLDSFTFAAVLSVCASVATLERGMEVHASSIRAVPRCRVSSGESAASFASPAASPTKQPPSQAQPRVFFFSPW